MATELALALFEDELRTVRELSGADRWQLERDQSVPLGVLATMHPRMAPNELYRARVRWADYFGPFSLKFINLNSGTDDDPTAWPQCAGFRPASLDACIALTAEGHALHPEWRNSTRNAFPKVDAPLQFALLSIQSLLDTSYSGRGRR